MIVCDFNNFTNSIPVYYVDNHNVLNTYYLEHDFNNFAEDLIELCRVSGEYKVRMMGSKEFCNVYIQNVEEKEKLKYNVNKIQIEVI